MDDFSVVAGIFVVVCFAVTVAVVPVDVAVVVECFVFGGALDVIGLPVVGFAVLGCFVVGGPVEGCPVLDVPVVVGCPVLGGCVVGLGVGELELQFGFG